MLSRSATEPTLPAGAWLRVVQTRRGWTWGTDADWKRWRALRHQLKRKGKPGWRYIK